MSITPRDVLKQLALAAGYRVHVWEAVENGDAADSYFWKASGAIAPIAQSRETFVSRPSCSCPSWKTWSRLVVGLFVNPVLSPTSGLMPKVRLRQSGSGAQQRPLLPARWRWRVGTRHPTGHRRHLYSKLHYKIEYIKRINLTERYNNLYTYYSNIAGVKYGRCARRRGIRRS